MVRARACACALRGGPQAISADLRICRLATRLTVTLARTFSFRFHKLNLYLCQNLNVSCYGFTRRAVHAARYREGVYMTAVQL